MSPYFKFKHSAALNKEGDRGKAACWPNKRVQRELGPADTGSLDTTDSSRVSVTPSSSTSSNSGTLTVAAAISATGTGITRDTDDVRETSHKGGSVGPKGFCLTDISGAQERWRPQAGNKSEGSEQVHCGRALQDGGLSHGEGHGETRGLASQNRPEGCLLFSANRPRPPEVPSVSVAGQSLSVPVPTIWPILCPSHVHKTDETSGSFPKGEGNKTHNISGRHDYSVQLSGNPDQPTGIYQGPVSGAGSAYQQQKVPASTLSRDCVLGSGNLDCHNAGVVTQRESSTDSTRGQAITHQARSVSTEASFLCRNDNSGKASNSGGPIVPSPPAGSDKQSSTSGIFYSRSETVLSSNSENVSRSHTRVGMVDAGDADLQRSPTATEQTRYGDRIGCFPAGLGSNPESPRVEDRGAVVSQRTGDAYKLPGTTSSIIGNSDLCQGTEKHQNFSENRQCVNQGIYKPLWGDSLMANESLSNTDMEMVLRTSDIPDSRAPPRINESGSRPGIKDSEGPLRLDATPTTVFADRGEDGTTGGGHVCIPANTSTSTVFQLETRPSSRSDGRIHPRLESISGVCESSMVSSFAYISEDSTGESQSGPGGPTMEDSTMVSSSSSSTSGNPPADSNTTGHSNLTNTGRVHNANRGATISRLAIVRDQSRSGGLSEGASRLLESSWRNKTKSTYESLFKRWDSWCQERDRNPIRGPVADVLNFLAELFDQGYQYRSLNAYRSAISSVHEKVDGTDVGKHPLVTRMLKGAFNERPPRPKYESVWKVDQVLTMFRADGNSDSLSLQDLTIKTVMLLALTRPCRGADLAELDLNNRSYVPEGVVFQPSHLSKQSRPSHNNISFFFPRFMEDKCLCPVETLKAYERKTTPFRNNAGENRVFRSFIGKHGPVTSSTIARWIKTCLQKAGVDTAKFKAHSTRAAAATKAAMSGLTVDEIMKAADWSSEGVFQKFYYRPQHSVEFGSSVLAASASKSHVDMETEPSEV